MADQKSVTSMINTVCARLIIIALVAPIQLLAPVSARAIQNPAPASQQPAETAVSLRSRISAHIAQPRYGPAAWGIKIISLDAGKTLFEQNAGKYFSPASNAKLYTTALALDHLGADYRIKTSLYAPSRPTAEGTLKGDLIIYGRGDPTIAASLNAGDYYKALEPLAEQVALAGVRRIEGDLIGDESYFKGPPLGSGWEWDDLQWYYGAEVSALTINDNALDLMVKPAERAGLPCRVSTGPPTSFVTLINRTQTAAKGTEARIVVYRPVGENIIYVSGRLPIGDKGYNGAVAVHNPAGLFVAMLKDALARRGISITGRVRTIDWKYREVTPIDFTKLVELGSIQSLPLKEIVRETMKPSQNLYAQLLLLQVGANPPLNADQPPDQTTEKAGIEAMNRFLQAVGVGPGEVVLEEGSGLSRKDLITPAATIELLRFMSRHRHSESFRDSLPIAGVDGTLKNRMKNTVATGNARAKTGSLSYVNTLSGYVMTASGERLAFSILLNNYYNTDRTASPREDIDAIIVMLAGFTGRSDN
jgi:D-alanyl-D-alanine carboxypeptidase/D-alanyl-D-alanine-endopeptidase (penicillin-binding protein 4)